MILLSETCVEGASSKLNVDAVIDCCHNLNVFKGSTTTGDPCLIALLSAFV